MKQKVLSGIIYSGLGSLWWGVVAVFYFKYMSFAGPVELIVHRIIWTAFILTITFTFFSRWNSFLNILKDRKKIFLLLISGFLIFINWFTWVYAVITNRLIDASFGYYIFPILSVLFGFIFFEENINKKKLFSIILVFISIIYLLFVYKSIPWIGIVVAISWSTYNLIRKKIKVSKDIGFFIESLFITPVALILFYFIAKNGMNDFRISKPKILLLVFIA